MKLDGFCCVAHPEILYFQRLGKVHPEYYENMKSKKPV